MLDLNQATRNLFTTACGRDNDPKAREAAQTAIQRLDLREVPDMKDFFEGRDKVMANRKLKMRIEALKRPIK